MSLSDLASLGSFVSGVAVLASLVFLFFQMRQMTEQVRQSEKNQRAVVNQGLSTRASDNIRWLAESPVNELRTRVIAGDTTFTAEELRGVSMAFRLALNQTQDMYVQNKAGLMDPMMFENAILITKDHWLSRAVFRALWAREAATFVPEFRAVIDAMIMEALPAKPVDAVAQFNA